MMSDWPKPLQSDVVNCCCCAIRFFTCSVRSSMLSWKRSWNCCWTVLLWVSTLRFRSSFAWSPDTSDVEECAVFNNWSHAMHTNIRKVIILAILQNSFISKICNGMQQQDVMTHLTHYRRLTILTANHLTSAGHFQCKFQTEGMLPTSHCWCQKTRVIALSRIIIISTVLCLVLSQTDGQNCDSQDRVSIDALHVINY